MIVGLGCIRSVHIGREWRGGRIEEVQMMSLAIVRMKHDFDTNPKWCNEARQNTQQQEKRHEPMSTNVEPTATALAGP